MARSLKMIQFDRTIKEKEDHIKKIEVKAANNKVKELLFINKAPFSGKNVLKKINVINPKNIPINNTNPPEVAIFGLFFLFWSIAVKLILFANLINQGVKINTIKKLAKAVIIVECVIILI